MTAQEKDRIECAIRHIKTAVDIDPLAAEIAVESMRKRITPTSVIVENGWMTKNDIAIHLINEIRNIILKNDSWTEDATTAVNEVADMAIKALEAQKWIPCNPSELPKDKKLWVTHYKSGCLYVDELFWDMTEWSDDVSDVIAYMPYVEPEPYKAESEDK
jgi:hypothetical protein